MWLVSSLPPHCGPLGEAVRCGVAASVLLDLAGPCLGYLFLLPLLFGLLPPHRFPLLLPLVQSALLPLAAALLLPRSGRS